MYECLKVSYMTIENVINCRKFKTANKICSVLHYDL